MMRVGSFAAIILGLISAAHSPDAWSADLVMPTKAPATASSAPATCTNPWDFIATNCQLTWYGITLYGTVDVGGGWQSHGASSHDTFPTAASYYIQKMNKNPMWGARA